MRISNIIWDFNGTLLDDARAMLAAVNDMLVSRGGTVMDFARYQSLVEMPIIRFYEKIDELRNVPPEQIFREFREGYARHSSLVRLANGALETLRAFERSGVRQIILSSFEQGEVERWLKKLEIARFFSAVLGAEDNRSESKEARGVEWSANNGVSRENALLVGDTAHDTDAARAMGVNCVLVSYGHQSRAQLEGFGARVIDDLRELIPLIERNY